MIKNYVTSTELLYQIPSNIPHWKQGTRLSRVDAGTTEALDIVQGNSHGGFSLQKTRNFNFKEKTWLETRCNFMDPWILVCFFSPM